MADESRNKRQAEHPDVDVANLGIVRPPLVFLTSILLGIILHAAWPLQITRTKVGTQMGAAVVIIAVILFVSAVRTFRRAGTPVPGNQPTTTIVRDGPYRFTRNPIYLAFSLFQLGLAFLVNSIWLLLTLAIAFVLMSLIVIPREERYLERRFPAEYRSYTKSVRRWL